MEFLIALWKYITVAAPYLVIGLFFAGLIHVFISVDSIKKVLGGNKISNVFKAAALGVPLPLCSCSVIPSAVTLRKSGASNGATSSFLIATPESGVDSIAMTYGMMDLPMTIIRPVAAFFSAAFAGILQFFFNDFEPAPEQETKSCCSKNKNNSDEKTFNEKLKTIFSYGFGDLLDDMAFWLTIGLVAGAMIDFVVPANFFDNLHQFGGRMLILAIGIPLYICASATTPIAASLVLKGMSPGMALLILLVGPATNMSNIFVIQKYIGKKGVLINVISIAVVALLFSYITDYIYTTYALPLDFKVEAHHDHGVIPMWKHLFGGVMVLLLLKSFYVLKLKKLVTKS